MHRLEITGETPDALYFNVVKTLSIFLRGTQAPASAAQETTPLSANGKPDESRNDGSIPSGGDKVIDGEVIAPKKTRGRPAASKKVEASPELNDDIPDLAADKKELTLEGDIRPRLMAIQKAHTDRGHDMPAVVAYIQKLYGPFGIAKLPQLKPEQFAEFMEASEAYLSGEA